MNLKIIFGKCILTFDEEKFKAINGVLTKKETNKINNTIYSSCGGFLLDGDVFKIDKDKDKNECITLKEVVKIEESFIPICGGIRLDKAIFKIIKDKITLIESPVALETNKEVPKSKVSFDSIEEFTIKVTNKDGEVVTPISEKEYMLNKYETYNYEAKSKNNTINGTITPKRRNNITETITF